MFLEWPQHEIGENQGSPTVRFLPLMLLIFMLINFSPLMKLFLFVPFEEDLLFFSFVKGSNLFRFSKFNWSSKKESEKLKKSQIGQIMVKFEFCTVSYRVSVM